MAGVWSLKVDGRALVNKWFRRFDLLALVAFVAVVLVARWV